MEGGLEWPKPGWRWVRPVGKGVQKTKGLPGRARPSPGGPEPSPPSSPPPPPRARAVAGRGQGGCQVDSQVQSSLQKRSRGDASPLPPASPSLEPLDGCVSTDSELIKSYLSSAVDTEPSGLARSGMRMFLRACRKGFAQTLVCTHPCPPPPGFSPRTPPAPHLPSPRWARPGREPRAGAGAAGERVVAQWLLIFSHPLPSSWVPGMGRFGQEASGEVIITCLSFSRDVQHLANRKYR